MSDTRHVKFSSSPPLRGVLKHPEPNPRDSGVGSSSSSHSGSSGSLDERFTARDYNLQSNNVDALREALADTIKDVENWKSRYLKKNNEQIETRRNLKNMEKRYQESCENNETMQARLESMEDRMAKQDVALDVANVRIRDLESDLSDQTAELSEWKDRYKVLHELYEAARHSADTSSVSGASGDHSVGRTRSHREKRDSAELTSRMKERINRDQTDSGSSHASKSSRSSEATVSSKRSSHRTNTSSSDKPYIEKMPRASASVITTNGLTSPRHHGSYTLTTASTPRESSSRKHGTSSSSRSGHRENGDYIAHPLPDRTRHAS
ncbi:hypothetical protein F5Y03DRAFT_151808 [Xylaria venustula]|nr:hypothetical protein F5Y03DRAFT_151808 [Xylaria venustula]